MFVIIIYTCYYHFQNILSFLSDLKTFEILDFVVKNVNKKNVFGQKD